MGKLTIALGTLLGPEMSKSYCPDCGADMPGNSCKECGYGMEDDGESESEGIEIQALLDVKNDLQRVMEKIDRLIVSAND